MFYAEYTKQRTNKESGFFDTIDELVKWAKENKIKKYRIITTK